VQFNSAEYVLFLPLVFLAFHLIPVRGRWALLLAASYFFYMCWRPEYALLLAFSTLVDYWAGLRMGGQATRAARRPYLLVSLLANLLLLASFKYLGFFCTCLAGALGGFDLAVDCTFYDIVLPIGISFYTLQSLSYVVDVYRGDREPERHLGFFALYVSYFPQLVAGPIERSTTLLPRLHRETAFDAVRVASGLRLILLGFIKKTILADRLGDYVNLVYRDPDAVSAGSLVLATYCFAFQIYCDFSGYTDIAIGSSRTLGYELMDNFRRPYFARGLREFWRRWHISLSTWFRDYLYIPLGGNRRGPLRIRMNLLVTFLLSGLWHGAGAGFVIWGALHGAFVLAGDGLRRLLGAATQGPVRGLPGRLADAARGLVTFHLVCFAWIFFRSPDLDHALAVLAGIASAGAGGGREVLFPGAFDLLVIGVFLPVVELVEWCRHGAGWRWEQVPGVLRWVLGLAALVSVFIFGVHGSNLEFIYFQF